MLNYPRTLPRALLNYPRHPSSRCSSKPVSYKECPVDHRRAAKPDRARAQPRWRRIAPGRPNRAGIRGRGARPGPAPQAGPPGPGRPGRAARAGPTPTGRCRLTCFGEAPGFIIVRQQPPWIRPRWLISRDARGAPARGAGGGRDEAAGPVPLVPLAPSARFRSGVAGARPFFVEDFGIVESFGDWDPYKFP